MQKKGSKYNFETVFFNADDRGRTGTGISSHGILSPGRLPVPPHRQITLLNLTTKLIIANFIIFVNSFLEKKLYNLKIKKIHINKF